MRYPAFFQKKQDLIFFFCVFWYHQMLPTHGENCYPLWYKAYRAKIAATLAIDVDSEAWKDFARFFHTLPARLEAAMRLCQQITVEKKIRDREQKEAYGEIVHGEHYRVWCALHYHYSYWQTDDTLRALLTSVELQRPQCDYDQPLFTKFASFLVSSWKMASGKARSSTTNEAQVPTGFALVDFVDGCSGIGHAAFHRAAFLTAAAGAVFGDTRKRKSAHGDERETKKQRLEAPAVIPEDESVIIDNPSPRVPTPPQVVSLVNPPLPNF